MSRRPPSSPLFPSPPLSRSGAGGGGRWGWDGAGFEGGGGGGAGRGEAGEPTRGSGDVVAAGAAGARGTGRPSISARRATNHRVMEPRSTSGSPGHATQSLAVASIPAASRDASMNP